MTSGANKYGHALTSFIIWIILSEAEIIQGDWIIYGIYLVCSSHGLKFNGVQYTSRGG